MSKPEKILLIEDEESLGKVITLNLELEGYQIDWILNGKEALLKAKEVSDYQLVILDVMLPEVSGWEICNVYKKMSDTPILFMSAKGTSTDKIKGLKLGADDYLAKPFDLEELLLRVQVLTMRQKNSKQLQNLKIGDFEVNLRTFEVLKDGDFVVELSKREIELLQLFDTHEGEVVSRDFILNQLWKTGAFPTARTIDNYILAFRKIFEKDPKNAVFFHSIRGVGYKFTNVKNI